MGTTGVSIVEHYCKSENKDFFYLFTSNPGCDKHNPKKCCEKHKENTSTEDNNCCKNTFVFNKLTDNFISSDNIVKTNTTFVALADFFIADFFTVKSIFDFKIYSFIPPDSFSLSGRNLLNFIEVFRI
jgi:hypothetical protein